MTSEPTECFVWIWPPGKTEPVVAGRMEQDGDRLTFNYGRSYLERPGAIAIYKPELPLQPGNQPPPSGLKMANCLRDAAPDAWGRRVIINRKLGATNHAIDTDLFGEMTYLLESGSDRTGALDFQASSSVYRARNSDTADLADLLDAAARVEAGTVVPPALDAALFRGSMIGGARPKALIESDGAKYIAKFSTSQDAFSVVKAEHFAMRLAALVGLDVAKTRLETAAGKDVLLVERFDRVKLKSSWARKAMVSALTLLGLDEVMARYASYEDLCEIIRHRFLAPSETLTELFGRLVFNVLCGNTDDHARNHAAFWDGTSLRLTPAYDICPQSRGGNEASQAMLILGKANRSSLQLCIEASTNFQLTKKRAVELIEAQMVTIRTGFRDTAEASRLSEIDQRLLASRQFFNASIFDEAPATLRRLGAASLL